MAALALANGRDGYITHLFQFLTYPDYILVEATNQDANRVIIHNAKHLVDMVLLGGTAPYFIDHNLNGPSRTEEPSKVLPRITCLALIKSTMPARDHEQQYSVLTIGWFQQDFALPIDAAIAKQIQSIDWDNVAEDRSD